MKLKKQTVLLIISILTFSSSEGIPKYFFAKNQKIIGFKNTEDKIKNCTTAVADSIFNPKNTIVVKNKGIILVAQDTLLPLDRYSENSRKIQFRKGDTIRLDQYLGEGFWNATYKNESIEMFYVGSSVKSSNHLKEISRFDAENWILIGNKSKCWIKDDDKAIKKRKLEF